MTDITVFDKKSGEMMNYDLPDDVLDAARKVYHWMMSQDYPEKVKLNGLALYKRESE